MTLKANRVVHNGIEVNSFVDFKNWQPGYEYTKNVFIKNFNSKSVKVSYEIPRTRFFVTLYPKVISLSPGTSYNLPVTFKPLENIAYTDEIKFRIVDTDKGFDVQISGSLPYYNLDFTADLNLGSCNAFENVSKQIQITNTTDLNTVFEWDVIEPFDVSPSHGEIKAKSTITVTFTATSLAALVYNGKGVCKYGPSMGELNWYKAIDLQVVGKYPHILVEADEVTSLNDEVILSFKDVPYGKCLTKQITIKNMTPVKTKYFIERVSSTPVFDCCFECSQISGVLEPNEKQKISVTYKPNSAHQAIWDYFCVYSSGKLTKSRFSCSGTSTGPNVTIEPAYLNFGQFDMAQTCARTFELTNLGDNDVAFQFDIDTNQSAFLLSTTNGTVKVNEKLIVRVTLKPQFPIIYYKRLACIIDSHNVLYVDLFGTAHNEVIKPALMNAKLLRNYYKLLDKGLTFNPPDKLVEMNSNGNLNSKFLNNDSVEFMDRIDGQQNDDNKSYSQYINDNYHCPLGNNTKLHVTLDNHYFDFGSSNTEQKTLNINNHTKGKLFICWNSSDDKIFTITPNNCEIPPLKSYSFRITFCPDKPSQFYGAMLEGYALYKSLCDYTLIDRNFVLPSWCLNVRCFGNSFHPCEERYLPAYTISTPNIIFPTNLIDKPVYRTFIIKNTAADYPLIFDFNGNSFSGDWYAKPLKGSIKANEHQIVLFKFVPKQEVPLLLKCEIKLNEINRNLLNVLLIANDEVSRLKLANDSIVYFKPTCKLNTTKNFYEIENLTRACVNIQWKVPYECKNVFSVAKVQDVLMPYEKKKCLWYFTPRKFDKFNMNVRLLTWLGDDKTKCKLFNLRLLGTCTGGSLQVADPYKDLGNIIVGSSVTNEICLINNSDCILDYELFVRQKANENSANQYTYDPCIIELDHYIGQLEAKSRKTIRFRLRPVRVNNYQFTIEYRIIYPNERSKDDNQSDDVVVNTNADTDYLDLLTNDKKKCEALCTMIAACVYPKLSVVDVKAIGPASNLSKDYLWHLFSIDTLNGSMNCEPNSDELIYSIATRQDVNRRIVHKPKTICDFNFGSALLFSANTEIGLLVENTGVLSTDWCILFPRDLQIELEYWSQKGDYDNDELDEMKVQDNKIFTITPSSGHLEPGETVRILFTYKHTFTGANKLPVLLKIDKGREIMINLIGVTLSANSSHVYIPNSRYQFSPLEIGLLNYPIQVYELYNGGDLPAHVTIDTTDLDNLNMKSFCHPILEYLSDKDIIIPPATSFSTKWRFSPLEAKTYQSDVIFRCNNETNIVTFTCIGYDARKLSNFTLKTYKNDEIPAKQLFLIPNQMASLSVDRVVFGDVPLLSRERKVVFIKNNSAQNQLMFNWHVTDAENVKYIRVQPSKGILGVNESKMCKITFLSKNSPSFYNIDLICEIKNVNDINKYKNALKKWETDQRRLWEEFKIDDSELENRIKSSTMKKDGSLYNYDTDCRASQLSLHNFKTIPPILSNNYLLESSVDKLRRLRIETKIVNKPIPPTPYLMHLNVLARTQYITEYLQSSNTNESANKYIDGLLGSIGEMTSNSNSLVPFEYEQLSCTDDEQEAIVFVLSDVLRSLISDTNFHALLNKIQFEQIPYFLQYSQKTILGTFKPRHALDNSHDPHISGQHFRFEDKRKRNLQMLSEKHGASVNKSERNLEKSQYIDENPIDTNDKKIEDIDVFDTKQKIKISPVFGSFVETILENAISNILTEAFNQEFSLTSRPRLIALPPKNQQPTQQTASNMNSTTASPTHQPVPNTPSKPNKLKSRHSSIATANANDLLNAFHGGLQQRHSQPNMARLKVPA